MTNTEPSKEAVEAAAEVRDTIILGEASQDWPDLPELAAIVQSAIDRVLANTKHAAMRALESFTPSGSEFVNDVKFCSDYIRKKLDSQHEFIVKKVLAYRQLGATLAEERKETLEVLADCVALTRCDKPIRVALPNPEGYAEKVRLDPCGKCCWCRAEALKAKLESE